MAVPVGCTPPYTVLLLPSVSSLSPCYTPADGEVGLDVHSASIVKRGGHRGPAYSAQETRRELGVPGDEVTDGCEQPWGAGNGTWILWKSSQFFIPLSHLSNSGFIIIILMERNKCSFPMGRNLSQCK